jgi:hypothetical protein
MAMAGFNREHMELVLEQHRIHPKFWAEFCDLVLLGRTPGAELQIRLECVSNYQAALNAVMTTLSQSIAHVFPPRRTPFPSLEYA